MPAKPAMIRARPKCCGAPAGGTGAVANAGREVLTGGRRHSLLRAAAIVDGFPEASLADQPQSVATISSVYPSGEKLIHAVDTHPPPPT